MKILESERIREQILALFKAEHSLKAISTILKVSYSTVKKVVARYRSSGTVERKKGSGRPKLLNQDDLAIIYGKINENPKLSTSKLATLLLEKQRKKASQETIRLALHSKGLFSGVAALKPFLSLEQIQARLKFAQEWSRWPFTKIKRILFSDESRFNLFQGDGKCRVWRLPGTRYDLKNCSPSVKFGGGSVMVWGCIGYNGVGRLEVIERTMDSILYTRVLSTCLHESAAMLGISDCFLFQQDNAPCHKSLYTRKFFEENAIDVLYWPSQSPDLNPIEHVWAFIDQELKKRVIKNKVNLINEIKSIWNEIPTSFIQKLFLSVPKRLELVIRNKGGHIPY